MQFKSIQYGDYMFFLACHSAEDAEEDERRKKRQTSENSITPQNTQILRDYFANCLRSSVSLSD